MTQKKYTNIALILTTAGTLFSGYLSGVKLFSGTCAFNESCPYFLGYPACYFGFVMFLTMFIGTLVAFVKKTETIWPTRLNLIVSGLGILFAGYFVVDEIIRYFTAGTPNYTLVFPTCVYGLIFYVIIFGLSVQRCRAKSRKS